MQSSRPPVNDTNNDADNAPELDMNKTNDEPKVQNEEEKNATKQNRGDSSVTGGMIIGFLIIGFLIIGFSSNRVCCVKKTQRDTY